MSGTCLLWMQQKGLSSIANFDIHDRVNYAVLSSCLEVKKEKKVIQMNLELEGNSY